MDHPFFGNWMPQPKKKNMSSGALDFINGKPLNAQSNNPENLQQDFEEQKRMLKEMEDMMDPEDRKLLSKAQGANPSNSVSSRFREAMKNMKNDV